MKRRSRQNLSGRNKEQNIEAFLAAVSQFGIIREAARAVGISHTNAANWRHDVPGFTERLEAAQEQGRERVAPQARNTLYQLGVVGVLEVVRDKQGRISWDPIDADGNDIPPRSKKKVAGFRKATRRVYNVKALELTLKHLYPGQFGDIHKFNVEGEITHTHDVADDVKKLLADRESLDLANALARRMAVNAGGDGQSSN